MHIHENLVYAREKLIDEAIQFLNSKDKQAVFAPDLLPLSNPHSADFAREMLNNMDQKLKRIIEHSEDELEILTEESFNQLTNHPLDLSISQKISYRQMLDYIIQMGIYPRVE